MEAIRSSETPIDFRRTTRFYIPEVGTLVLIHLICWESKQFCWFVFKPITRYDVFYKYRTDSLTELKLRDAGFSCRSYKFFTRSRYLLNGHSGYHECPAGTATRDTQFSSCAHTGISLHTGPSRKLSRRLRVIRWRISKFIFGSPCEWPRLQGANLFFQFSEHNQIFILFYEKYPL
jgi:hypothetical protein